MFDKWTSLFRLAVFLLLSTGVHAGVVIYEWAEGPAEPHQVRVPVTVSLVPVNATAPSRTVVQSAPDQPARKVVNKQQPKVSKKVVKNRPLPAPEKVRVTRVEQAVVEPAVDEKICRPLQVVDCSQSEVVASVESLPDMLSAGDKLTVVENAPENREAGENVAPFSGEMSEAIPDYRSNPLPDYPYLARQRRWEGVVWLRVDVSADGLVDDLTIEKSCGHAVLDREASRTVRRWQFSPAERAGMPVASQVRIPVRFRLEDG